MTEPHNPPSLREALAEAIELIHAWHGDEVWAEYQESPEMKRLNGALAAHPEAPPEPPKFPTMLRKMWSGGEVQEWINAHWNLTALRGKEPAKAATPTPSVETCPGAPLFDGAAAYEAYCDACENNPTNYPAHRSADVPRSDLLDKTLRQYAHDCLRSACTAWSDVRDPNGDINEAKCQIAASHERTLRSAIDELANDTTREAATNELQKQLARLYLTAQDVCACAGFHGSIDGRDHRVSRLMDALAAIDGGSQDGAPGWMREWADSWHAATFLGNR